MTRSWKLLTVLASVGLMVGILSGCYYDQAYDDSTGVPGQGVQGPRLSVTVQPRWLPANGSATAVALARLVDLQDGSAIPNQEILFRLQGFPLKYLHFQDQTDTIRAWTDEAGNAIVVLHTGACDHGCNLGSTGLTGTVRADTVLRYYDDWTDLTTATDLTIYDSNVDL